MIKNDFEMRGSDNYIRFDWAMKRLLRNKANFGVLEGLLTTLLGRKIIINKLLESESNQEDEYDKQNRVDILAEDDSGQLFLIEVQNNTEYTYFQRMIFGTSKLITEYINRGEGYENVRKVYSVNIVYFPLGHGTDYVYHGTTEFRGMHNGDILELSPFQQQRFSAETVSDLYPEYYILKVNDFNKVATTPLEEWIYYLHTGKVPESATASGLTQVREQLKLDSMSKKEIRSYYRYLDNLVILHDNIFTSRDEAHFEGYVKGLAEGRAEGYAEGKAEGIVEGIYERKVEANIKTARRLKQLGVPIETIMAGTGLTEEEIRQA